MLASGLGVGRVLASRNGGMGVCKAAIHVPHVRMRAVYPYTNSRSYTDFPYIRIRAVAADARHENKMYDSAERGEAGRVTVKMVERSRCLNRRERGHHLLYGAKQRQELAVK